MKKVAILFHEGFEEIEALSPCDVLRRAKVQCDLVGMEHSEVESSHGVTIKMDKCFDDNMDQYDMIILPGGLPGATFLRDDARVIELIQRYHTQGKWIAAICAAPIVFAKAGVTQGKHVTSYPTFRDHFTQVIYHDQEGVIVDGHMITACGAGVALEFSYEILEALGIDSQTYRQSMQYQM